MFRTWFFSFVMVVSLTLLSCAQKGKDKPKADDGSSSNAQTVTIGKQVWMTRNLDVSTFRNCDTIPEAKTECEWKAYDQAGKPAWCYYNNDPANGAKYGKLYNWYAVSDPRGLAPKGWHVPSDVEWAVLIDYLGGEKGWPGYKMKSKLGWDGGGNGTNSSGFSGLPGGYRYEYGSFYGIGHLGYWWSSTEDTTYYQDLALARPLFNMNDEVFRNFPNKGWGCSVRCLRD